MNPSIPEEFIEYRIHLLRGQKVMLSRDLAELYGVPTKVLTQAVKRHINRFPADFMFQLNQKETKNWKSQIVISNSGLKMGLRTRPFTEQGVAMLSSVLNSERAVEVNIRIIRAFVKLRQLISSHKDLSRRLDELEGRYDFKFRAVFAAIRRLMEPPKKLQRKIGFQT